MMREKNVENENTLQEIGQLSQYPAKVSQAASSSSAEQARPVPPTDNANASPAAVNCNADIRD